MYDVITIGSAVRDTYFFLKREDSLVIENPHKDPTRKMLIGLEYGGKINADKTFITVGGGAVNAAATFKRFGYKVAPYITVGDDPDAQLIQSFLKQEKIAPALVQVAKKETTGFSVLVVTCDEQCDRVALVERGANDTLQILKKHEKELHAKALYTTALTGSNWRSVLSTIVEQVKKHTMFWAWNPGGEQLAAGPASIGKYLKHCSALLLNRDEALELAMQEDPDIQDSKSALLDTLLAWGPERVIITDGIKGVYYADAEQRFHMMANERIPVIERTGAGDAFGSAFTAGMLATKFQNVAYALDVAICNAESVIQEIGPHKGILDKKELEKHVGAQKHAIKRLR